MSRWVSGLAGSRSFMSVPVHTGEGEDVGQDTAHDLLQSSRLLHTHSLESCHLRQGDSMAEPFWMPMPLHPHGLEQKNALVFGKKLANGGKAPFLAGPPCAFSGAPMCQPFRAYQPYRVSAGKESLPLSQN